MPGFEEINRTTDEREPGAGEDPFRRTGKVARVRDASERI
jgi:hypothetical protein